MRRVLYLIKGLGRGGAEQSILNGVRYHDTSRFLYELAYVMPQMDELASEFEAMDVRLHCLGGRGRSWVRVLRSLVREREIDVIHAHSPLTAAGARVGLRGRTRIVYSEQNVWDAYHPATRWANMITFPLNDHVLAVSDHVRRSMRYPKALPLKMPPVSVVHHGLDWSLAAGWGQPNGARAKLGLPADAPVVGTVANYRPEKGQRYLIEAAAIVRRTVPDVRFVLVGNGPLEGDLRRQVAELGLEDTVILPGYRGPATSILSAFDVFILPSIYEGLSIAALEAMAAARPMIVSAIGPLQELMGDPPAGLVVPHSQPEAIASALVEVLTDPVLERRLAESAQRRAKVFDVRNVVARSEEIYERLVPR
jgi:glycosyltransferase involved in cell wall biosynthesis